MTTVVALVTAGAAWMAADTTTNVYDRPVVSAKKICRLETGDGSEVLIGFAGEGAGPAIARRHLSIEERPSLDAPGDCDDWANAVASAITELYVDRGMVDGQRIDGTIVLAIPGHLWTITHHQAIRHPDGMAAIGSGEGPALGALHALTSSSWEPGEAMRKACEIGILLDRFSGGPVDLEHLVN